MAVGHIVGWRRWAYFFLCILLFIISIILMGLAGYLVDKYTGKPFENGVTTLVVAIIMFLLSLLGIAAVYTDKKILQKIFFQVAFLLLLVVVFRCGFYAATIHYYQSAYKWRDIFISICCLLGIAAFALIFLVYVSDYVLRSYVTVSTTTTHGASRTTYN
ncbi:hypothetical protein SNEBB_005939 [Seison nebaliae]|nr:hypothetical protein SNEBB_005939 [Seison nebaliae]